MAVGISEDEVKSILQKLSEVIPEGKTQAETVLRYVIDNPAITTAVVGIRIIEQLNDAIAGAKSDALTASQWKQLQEIWAGNTYKEHR